MTSEHVPSRIRLQAAALRAETARREARRRFVLACAVVAAVVLVALGVFVAAQGSKGDAAGVPLRPAGPANLGPSDSIVVGAAGAPVTMVVYEDFQCPACRAFEEANASQLGQWVEQGVVRVEYRPVAFLDRFSNDRYSTRSLNAVAAVVNTAPSAYPAFHGALFARQPAEGGAGLTDAELVDLAVAAGAPRGDVAAAVSGLSFAGWVATVTENASKANVSRTPTIIVNGTVVATSDPAGLRQAVEAAQR